MTLYDVGWVERSETQRFLS